MKYLSIGFTILLILVLVLVSQKGCSSCSDRRGRQGKIETAQGDKTQQVKVPIITPAGLDRRVSKAVFYIENSESMFGYVNGPTQYVEVLSELAEKPKFVEEKTLRDFYFINGGTDLRITHIGDDPSLFKTKLNTNGFRCGDITKSNLNSMFQIAMKRARTDTISILISDAIYDIGRPIEPLKELLTRGKETRSRFIERLHEGDLQTIIVKLNSHFAGSYFPVTGGSVKLAQERPFYVWIFGETELLNEYFPEDYIQSLKGYSDVARFLKLTDFRIPYQATAHEKVGGFRFDKKDKNKLVNVKTDRKGQGFQFTFAADFSTLPFSDSYLNSISNYSCSNPNYSVEKVCKIGGLKLYGLGFEPTHLITVYTNKNPLCQLNISLLNTVPDWIRNTNIDIETNIIGDTSHTFGFKVLTNAICQAYHYKNQETNIVNFKFELN